MPSERRQRLETIGFVWDVLENALEEGFAALTTFKAREGHCRVPALHIEGTFKLGKWVRDQRRNGYTLPAETKHRLDTIGFVWDPHENEWEEGFAALTIFKTREGHCHVPQRIMSKARSSLGNGSVYSARTETKCPLNAGKRLDEIGFVWREKLGPSPNQSISAIDFLPLGIYSLDPRSTDGG